MKDSFKAELNRLLQQESDPAPLRTRVEVAREAVAGLCARFEADQGQHLVPPEVKTETLRDAQAHVAGLKRQLGI